MAPFNPQIQPTSSPNYGSNSRAVDVPMDIRPQGVQQNQIMPRGQEIGDRSAEFEGKAAEFGSNAEAVGIKGVGDLFSSIVGMGDFLGKAGVAVVKKDIENRVYDVADRTRREYTSALETIKAGGPGVQNIINASAEGDGESNKLPSEVEGLPDHLDNLTGARDAGKISNTYYLGRLLAEAKDLRARYPGFREEIDQQFAKVTGVNPANAYITSLVHDINKQGSSQAAEKNKVLTYIQSNLGLPNAQEKFRQFNAGEITRQDVINWAAPYEQEKYQLSTGKQRLDASKASREEKAVEAGDLLDKGAGVVVGRSVDALLGQMGLSTEAAAADLDSRFKAGAIPASRFAEIGQMIADHRTVLKTQMLKDADQQGLTALVGGKSEVIKRVDAALTQLDTLQDRVYNKDFGGIYSAARAIKAQTDDNQKHLLAAPDGVGDFFQQMKVQKEIGGEQWVQKFNLDSLRKDIPQKYKDYVESWSREMGTQTNMRNNGIPTTLNSVFDDFKRKKVNDPKATSAVIGEISRIADPNTPDAVKENYALTAFSPQNRGFISRLNPDGVDSRGRQIKGQNAVFQQLTTPEITKEIRRLSDKNPQIWTNYQNWAKETFGNELLNKEINDLKNIGEDPNLKIAYDADNHRFDVRFVPTPEARQNRPNATGLSGVTQDTAYLPFVHARNSINRINSGLNNLKNIASADNQDIDAYLLRTITEAGGNLAGVKNIPNEMLRQIDLSRQFNGRFNSRAR